MRRMSTSGNLGLLGEWEPLIGSVICICRTHVARFFTIVLKKRRRSRQSTNDSPRRHRRRCRLSRGHSPRIG